MIESEDTATPLTLVTAEELAATLNVSRSTIYHLTQAGRIPHYKTGRLVRFNLDAVLNALHHEAIDQAVASRPPPPAPRQRRTLPKSDWSTPLKLD